MDYMRYRDFVAALKADAAENPDERIVENRYIAETFDHHLVFLRGRNGGVGFEKVRRHGRLKTEGGSSSFLIPPDVLKSGLAEYMARPEMMDAGRAMLTPGDTDPLDAMTFAVGLHSLPVNPFPEAGEGEWSVRPPSLDPALWSRIPIAKRQEWCREMALGLRRGIHPDDTASALLGDREAIR